MTTLDIFAKNIMGNSDSVTNFSMGENSNRWLQIKAPSGSGSFANFFIVKKLSPTDSQSVSSAIDSTTASKSNLIFDNNGNIQASGSLKIQNPLATKPVSILQADNKQFQDSNIKGYCESRDIIFSSNLKWILYRDKNDANQMYILYNPMHRQNVKDYYASISANNLNGDDGGFMRTLIEKYRNVFTIKALNDETKTQAKFAEPTCACYDRDNCANDAAGFYLNPNARNITGPACACNSIACNYTQTQENKDKTGESFLNLYLKKYMPEKCPTVSVCQMIFDAAGNINVKDANIQQNCGASQINTQAPTQPPTQAPTEAPTQAPTEAPTQAPSKLSKPLIIGGGIGIALIIAIIVSILIYQNDK